MGIGKEVAEAYINVHGDVEPFRKDLEKAAEAARAEGEKSADEFTKAYEERFLRDQDARLNAIHDAIYSNDPIDWERALGKFDPHSLDAAHEAITSFFEDQIKQGALTEDQFAEINHSIEQAIRDREGYNAELAKSANLERDHTEALKEYAIFQRDQAKQEAEATRLQDAITRAYFAAEREDLARNQEKRRLVLEDFKRGVEEYNRTFDGMVAKAHDADLESGFRNMADAMARADFGKFAKGFDDFPALRDRVTALTDAMREQGRITDENALAVHAAVDDYIRGEEDKARAIDRTKEETRLAKEETERYKKSLAGMVDAARFDKMEEDFKSLSRAMATSDFSHIAKDFRDFDTMSASIRGVVADMQRLGRVTDTEAANIGRYLDSLATSHHGLAFATSKSRGEAEKSVISFAKLGSVLSSVLGATKGLQEHLGGFAGLNVFGDLIESSFEFLHNLDRIAVSVADATAKLATMTSVIGSALQGLVVLAEDLGHTLGGFSALLPAFATGAGIMLFIAGEALQGFGKKYKKELESFREDLLAQINKGFDPAMDRFSNTTLPAVRAGINETGAAMGRMFGTILDAISNGVGADGVSAMFDRMDKAMDKSRTGVAALVDAWGVLGDAGSQYFDRFAGWINDISTRFDNFIKTAAANGDLNTWIETGIDGFKDLGRTIDGTLGIINAIDSAARAAGAGGLKSLANSLQGIAKTMQSPAYQRTMTELFTGMNTLTGKLGTAIRNLGPAFASIMPFVKIALSDIGDTISTLIGYIGQVLDSPAVHQSITNFSLSMKVAMDRLAPAVKPFTDSLAQATNLLGKILVNVADLVTAFTVNFSPVLDLMSAAMETLISPLTALTQKLITALTEPFKRLANEVIIPTINAIRTDLLPAVSDAIPAIAPLVDAAIGLAGPALVTFARDILPNIVKLAADLAPYVTTILKFATPLVKDWFDGIGKTIKTMADNMDGFNAQAKPFLDHLNDIADKASKEKIVIPPEENTNPWLGLIVKWDFALLEGSNKARGLAIMFNTFGKTWTDGLTGFLNVVKHANPDDIRNAIIGGLEKALPVLSDLPVVGNFIRSFGNLSNGIGTAWNTMASVAAVVTNPERLRNTIITNLSKALPALSELPVIGPFIRGFGTLATMIGTAFQTMVTTVKILTNPQELSNVLRASITAFLGTGGLEGIQKRAEAWWDDHLFKPLRVGWDMAWAALNKWWADRKKDFQHFMNNLLGFGDKDSTLPPATVSGGGAGAKGGSIGAAIEKQLDMKNMSFMDIFKATITGRFADAFAGIKGAIDRGATVIKGAWDVFWALMPAPLRTAFETITGTTSEKTAETQGHVQTFTTGTKPIWDTLWNMLPQPVRTAWEAITGNTQSSTATTQGHVSGLAATMQPVWDVLWGALPQPVRNAWDLITGTSSTSSSQTQGHLNNVGNAKPGWDWLWGDMATPVTGAWASILGGTQQGTKDTTAETGSLPGRIKGSLGFTGLLLSPAGASIMSGLLSGLQAGWPAVQFFVGTIANYIRDHKGPLSYDRVLLTPAGQVIMEGLLTGLESRMPALKDSLSRITDLMAGALGGTAGKSKMYLAGVDAAQGLADGIASNKNAVSGALTGLAAKMTVTTAALGRLGTGTPADQTASPVAAGGVYVAPGAVQITTPTTDPSLVANKTIDGIIQRVSLG